MTDSVCAQAVLGLAIAPPLVAIFTYVLLNSGRLLVVYIWAFALAVQLTGLTIYPYIARLFNKFEPLPEGELRCAAPHALLGRRQIKPLIG